MCDPKTEHQELSEEELAAQQGEPLPDREVMSVITPEVGRIPDVPVADDDSTVETYPRDPLPIQ